MPWSCTGAALELHWSYQDRAAGALNPQPTPIPKESRREGGSSNTQGSSTLPVTDGAKELQDPLSTSEKILNLVAFLFLSFFRRLSIISFMVTAEHYINPYLPVINGSLVAKEGVSSNF